MNPIFKYSLDCGVMPTKPQINTSFFPITFDKYIILESSSAESEYPHMDEISSYLSGILRKNSINILQLKFSEKDEDILGAKKYQGLSLSQFNFLIENSMLVISNSRYTTECANCLETPSILITKKELLQKDNPKWYNENYKEFKLDSFGEQISSHALNTLGLNNPLDTIEPIYCGDLFKSKILEIIPNFHPEQINIRNENINLRADYHQDEKNIIEFIEHNKVNLITNKVPSTLGPHKNLIQINLEVSLNTTEEDIEKIKKSCKNVFFFSRDSKQIQKIRLKFIDEIITLEKRIRKKDLDICDKICDNTYYKSSKIIISEGKNYTSLASKKKNIPLVRSSLEKVIDCDDFWDESEHFKLININHG